MRFKRRDQEKDEETHLRRVDPGFIPLDEARLIESHGGRAELSAAGAVALKYNG